MLHPKIEVVSGDITTFEGDAIVNAANRDLAPGGGVCGAIHYAAGPELEDACRAIGHCATGSSVVTGGFNLAAKHVIHTVGPIWGGGNFNEDGELASCYDTALHAAVDVGARTVAFPVISAGIYGYPLRDAIEVAIDAVGNWLNVPSNAQHIDKVTFYAFGERAAAIFEEYVRG